MVQRLKGKTAYKMLQEFALAAEGVLGPAPVGAGIFLLQQRERDGPGDRGVPRQPGGRPAQGTSAWSMGTSSPPVAGAVRAGLGPEN